MNNPTPAQLPDAIRKPIWRAAFTALLFLVGVVLWARLSEITTTIRVPGAISTPALSYKVQTINGGQISDVAVRLHDTVQAGDLLYQFDTSELDVQLQALSGRAEFLKAELAEIRPRLGLPSDDQWVVNSDFWTISSDFNARDDWLETQVRQSQLRADSATNRMTSLAIEQTAQQRLVTMLAGRLAKTKALEGKGFATATETEKLTQALLQAELSLAGLASRRGSLQAEQLDSELQIELSTQDFKRGMTQQALEKERELISIRAETTLLKQRIINARVMAPVGGKVTEILFTTVNTVVRPSETMAVLSQELNSPEIELLIAVNDIDAVSAGGTGVVTLPSLPQRNAPIIHAKILSVAREPVRDPAGTSQHYLARATIDEQDLVTARKKLGKRFRLSVGMPVSFALEHGKTNPWDYFLSPFTGLLSRGLQE